MSQNNAAAAQTATVTDNTQTDANGKQSGNVEVKGLSKEQLEFITKNPQVLMGAVDRAVRRHKIQKVVTYVGVGGVLGLIGYGIFRATRG